MAFGHSYHDNPNMYLTITSILFLHFVVCAVWLAYTFDEVEKLRLSTVLMNVYSMDFCINMPKNSWSIEPNQMVILNNFFFRISNDVRMRRDRLLLFFNCIFIFCITFTDNRNDTINVCR